MNENKPPEEKLLVVNGIALDSVIVNGVDDEGYEYTFDMTLVALDGVEGMFVRSDYLMKESYIDEEDLSYPGYVDLDVAVERVWLRFDESDYVLRVGPWGGNLSPATPSKSVHELTAKWKEKLNG